MKDERLRTHGPEPSAARLGPRAFSVGGVGSFEEGLVHKFVHWWFVLIFEGCTLKRPAIIMTGLIIKY